MSAPAPLPSSFGDYLRSFGPGLIIVLTWLGAGDIVDMGVAGSNYGYSLMWVLVFAVAMRYLFVARIAQYHLCNERRESVLDGLVRLHPLYAPGILAGVVLTGLVGCGYMTIGCGEVCRNIAGFGEIWQWALACNASALLLVFRPSYARIETVFKLLLAVLSVSFVGSAIWVGFAPADLLEGLVRLELPGQQGHFNPTLVAVSMIGAVGGSLMNLAYPYFLEAKGWTTPAHRRVQTYDFILAMVVMVLLNLAVWILGAELLFPDRHIRQLDDLPQLLSTVLGPGGRWLFYFGIFAAVYTSLVGHAVGLAALGVHSYLRWRSPDVPGAEERQHHPLYRGLVIGCLVLPLAWTIPGAPDFVTLTIVANSANVVLLPALAGGLWWITASARFIGPAHRNRWWENAVMAVLFVLAVYGALASVRAIVSWLTQA